MTVDHAAVSQIITPPTRSINAMYGQGAPQGSPRPASVVSMSSNTSLEQPLLAQPPRSGAHQGVTQARSKRFSPNTPPSAIKSVPPVAYAPLGEGVVKAVVEETEDTDKDTTLDLGKGTGSLLHKALMNRVGIVLAGLLLLGVAWSFTSPSAINGDVDVTHNHDVPIAGGQNSSSRTMRKAKEEQTHFAATTLATTRAPLTTPAQSKDVATKLRGNGTPTHHEQPTQQPAKAEHTHAGTVAKAGSPKGGQVTTSAHMTLEKWQASGKAKVCTADNLRCDGGGCDQSGCNQPFCDGGGCKQINAFKPDCDGGRCDQSGAILPSCSGEHC